MPDTTQPTPASLLDAVERQIAVLLGEDGYAFTAKDLLDAVEAIRIIVEVRAKLEKSEKA